MGFFNFKNLIKKNKHYERLDKINKRVKGTNGKALNGGICPHKKINRVLVPLVDRRFNNKSQMDKNTKIDWPSNDKLVEMCNSISMNSVAKILGVCRSSLTKRLKNRNLYDLVTKRYKNKSDKL